MTKKISEISTSDFIQFADDFFYILDYNGYITFANPAVERLLHYSQEEIIGKHFTEFVREDWKQKIGMFYHEQFTNRIPSTFTELPVITRDGDTVWIEQNTRMILDTDADRIIGYQTISRDVTKRRLAEERLNRKSEYLAALHETTLAMMNRRDLLDVLDFIAQRAVSIMQTEHGFISMVEPDESGLRILNGMGHFGKRIASVIKPGEGVSGLVWKSGTLFVTDDYQSLPFRLPGDDLKVIRCMVGIPLKSGDRVTGVIGIARSQKPFDADEIEFLTQYSQLASMALENARDHSVSKKELEERMRVEEDLRSSRSNLIDIINYLPDPTFVINARGEVTAWNQALEELTGIEQDDMLGKGNHEYSIPFYGDRRPLLADFALEQTENLEDKYSIMKVERDTLIAEIYTPYLREGGAYLWEKAKPLYDSAGKIVGAIETVRDLTDRKQAEESLRAITQQVVRNQLALHELSKMKAVDLDSALKNILEIDTRTLSADRVSLWFIRSDIPEISSPLRFTLRGNIFETRELNLLRRDETHLRALENNRIITVTDLADNAPARELMGDHLLPDGMISIMSVTIRLGGNVVGFLCHEHSTPREWTLEEQDFVTSIADLIALAIETSERSRAETRPAGAETLYRKPH